MRNIKLTIEYDGSNYCGWQKQKNHKTVQQVIEEAIYKAIKEKVEITGSSRTDSGVHAKGMTANFYTESSVPSSKFREAINSKLPDDVAILESEEVSKDFHSRYCSKGKTYSYTIVNRYEKVALKNKYVYHVKDILNVEDMKKACDYFIGTYDFSAFKSSGSSVKTSIRTIWSCNIEKNNDEIKLLISGDGFLYNMVRIIVGTLVEVGKGKIKAKDIEYIINSRNRALAGPCAPPNGLILEKVYYEK